MSNVKLETINASGVGRPVTAESPVPMWNAQCKPVLYSSDSAAAHQTLSVGSGAVVTTSGITKGALTKLFVITVDGVAIRLTLDGSTSPTSTIGLSYPAGAELRMSRAEFLAAKFITASGTATLQIAQETD